MLEEERAVKQAKRDLHKTGMSENPLRFEFICDQSFTHFKQISVNIHRVSNYPKSSPAWQYFVPSTEDRC